MSNPKTLLGLLVGGILPYLVTAILATITKWLVFVAVLKRRPDISKLCAVAISEPFCFLVAMMSAVWLSGFGIPRYFTMVAYLVLAMFPNLVLFPPVNEHGGNGLPKRGFFAFAAGSIYLGYVFFSLAVYSLV